MLHHKTMVVDGVWATIGTTNFDNRSFAHNEENNVCVFDPSIARQLMKHSKPYIAGCQKIQLEEWRSRGPWRQIQEFVASFLQDQV